MKVASLRLADKISKQPAHADRKAHCQQPPAPSRWALAVHSLKKASVATIPVIHLSATPKDSFSGSCALRTTAAPSIEEIKTDFVDALSRQTVEKFGNPRPLLSDQLTLDVPPPEI
jgi:hypothetical protein